MSALARWRALDADERRALPEAFASLFVASLLVRRSPFKRVARLAARPARRAAPADPARDVALVGWAIAAAARRARFRAVCIEQGLAAQMMLRRRGVAAVLHYGVARDEARGLVAHVWVKWREVDVVGGRSARGFKLLARFPDEGA